MAAEELGEAGQGGVNPAEPPEVFCYGPEELVLRGAEWPRSGAGPAGSPPWSRFDRALLEGWEERLRRGLFRYRLGRLQTRVLPGRLALVAQLNVQRAAERRRPQEVRSVRQSFDPRQFNFGQIRREEILFCLRRRCPGLASSPRTLVAINVSPLERGHVLLIPDPALALPQVLTPEALLAGLDAVLLSAHPGFRLGFNSLGAFASVNHLHLHGFYLDWELSVESAPGEPLLPEAGLYLLREAPAPAFFFYCEDVRQVEPLAHRIGRATRHLSQREIAHNLFATRGAAPAGPLGSRARSGLRVLLWARKACFGTKEELAFNVAVCELAGHLPTKTVQEYEGLTEASALHRIQQCLLPDSQLAHLQQELVDLLRELPPSPPWPSLPQGRLL
ncbi:PREDICTED: GDP-D-glucose phosphorylase 1 [Thamnophis sirtalis]|uniref:GDP-D-glucose phosphorylase 1 n=1 Tax=Thamnophis sirtalis TaxID=35019 RepID=A0A6I9YKG2_9SAUR|nr:PREDICTED: GDP-D-glucose phosphorylase 1 [Thamnophis sirtalis]